MSAHEFRQENSSTSKEAVYADEQTDQLVSELGKAGGASAQVTIQLPEGMQSNSISQQKMQELIMHLSQSGQLKDDGKIIIEVGSFTYFETTVAHVYAQLIFNICLFCIMQVKGNQKPLTDIKSVTSETSVVEYTQLASSTPTLSQTVAMSSPMKGSQSIRYSTVQHSSSPATPKTAVRSSDIVLCLNKIINLNCLYIIRLSDQPMGQRTLKWPFFRISWDRSLRARVK